MDSKQTTVTIVALEANLIQITGNIHGLMELNKQIINTLVMAQAGVDAQTAEHYLSFGDATTIRIVLHD
jgi:hypothetical protein